MHPDWFPDDEIPEMKIYGDFHKLTEGGFAEIYTAIRDEGEKKTPVVVKRLKPMLVKEAWSKKAFENEARILKRIKHELIPHYYEGFISERECFYIMEQVKGRDPSRLLKNARSSGKDFPWELTFFITLQIGEILDYMHHAKASDGSADPILHCDIKPHNFLVNSDPKVHLIDFSIAKPLRQTNNNILEGTLIFMPPEQIAGGELSFQSDLIALTLSLYFMAAREPLMRPGHMGEIFGNWLSQSYYETIRKKKFPTSLENFFLKNLSFEPETRAQSVRELINEMKKCVSDLQLDISPAIIASQVRNLETIS